jgi:hypothetical protein
MADQMNSGRRGRLIWPLVLAGVFFFIPVTLFFTYPFGFWSSTDYEPLGLADALNMAYRLGDVRLYPAEGMNNHPGVLFYLMSWLALAISGHPVAGQANFYRDVIDHIEDYHRASILMAALAGAAGVYVFARTALKFVPIGATSFAVLLWLVSTPATIVCFLTTGFEPVALLLNGLFLAVLVRLAFDREIDLELAALAALVGAFAYLNKLSYLYIPVALAGALFWKAVFLKAGWRRGARPIAFFAFIFIGTVVATGYFIIGWSAFRDLLRFHRNVFFGSGLYGAGEHVVVSGEGVRHAIASIPADMTYAVPLALIAGTALLIAGLVTGLGNRQRQDVAVMGIGVGLAALLAALAVVKHYAFHYTAGVSAALPACVVACCLFAQAWDVRFRRAAAGIAMVAILLMAGPVVQNVLTGAAYRSDRSRLALEDIKEIGIQTADMKHAVYFTYHAPFPQNAEGFVINNASVPRLKEQYLKSRGGVTNNMVAFWVTEEVSAYVIDKNYFRDVEAVKSAPNLDLLGPRPVRFNADDKLIELHTVFLLIRK